VQGMADQGYDAAPATFSFEDISSTGTIIAGLTGTDDASVSLGMGISFPFFGTNNTTVFVSSNGLLTFGGADISFTNTDLTPAPRSGSKRLARKGPTVCCWRSTTVRTPSSAPARARSSRHPIHWTTTRSP